MPLSPSLLGRLLGVDGGGYRCFDLSAYGVRRSSSEFIELIGELFKFRVVYTFLRGVLLAFICSLVASK